MLTQTLLCLGTSVLATEADHHTNPPEDNDIALARQQAALAQKEAKKWLDQNKGDFLREMDKSVTGKSSLSQGSASRGSSRQAAGRRASSGRDFGSRASCPSRLFDKQGDKAEIGANENKGGGCFSKGAPPLSAPPEGVLPEGAPPEGVSAFSSSSHSLFRRGSETLAPLNPKNLLIFVSFSMPESSLKSLSREAQKQGAVLVMRGLYRDSFVQTAQKLQQLGITVDIHPKLFETHHIVSVPTFVKIDNGRPLYSLKGNVTLDFALKKFNPLVGNQPIENPLVGDRPVGNQHANAQRTKEAP